MLRIFFFFTLLTISTNLFAQTNWSAIENKLNTQREQKRISSNGWHSKLKKDAGHFDRLSLWVKNEDEIANKSGEKIQLYFPTNFQIVMPNGNKYAKAYLINNTTDSIEIARIDATLANVQEYFLIKNKWIAFRKNGTSTCGNSYFSNKLAPNHQLSLELSNDVLTDGNNKIPYKISILLGTRLIECNVIQVKLHDSQLKRMMESVVALN